MAGEMGEVSVASSSHLSKNPNIHSFSMTHAQCDWQTKGDLGSAYAHHVKVFNEAAESEGLNLQDKDSLLLLHEAAKRVKLGKVHGWPWALGL